MFRKLMFFVDVKIVFNLVLYIIRIVLILEVII